MEWDYVSTEPTAIAKEGASYKEILKYYYEGIDLYQIDY